MYKATILVPFSIATFFVFSNPLCTLSGSFKESKNVGRMADLWLILSIYTRYVLILVQGRHIEKVLSG